LLVCISGGSLWVGGACPAWYGLWFVWDGMVFSFALACAIILAVRWLLFLLTVFKRSACRSRYLIYGNGFILIYLSVALVARMRESLTCIYRVSALASR
jgi:hypothetical protein